MMPTGTPMSNNTVNFKELHESTPKVFHWNCFMQRSGNEPAVVIMATFSYRKIIWREKWIQLVGVVVL
jgi:hypothetical protein